MDDNSENNKLSCVLFSKNQNLGKDVCEENTKCTESKQLTLSNSNVPTNNFKSSYAEKLIEAHQVVIKLNNQYLNTENISRYNENRNTTFKKKQKRLRVKKKSDPEVNNISHLLKNSFQSDKENISVNKQEIFIETEAKLIKNKIQNQDTQSNSDNSSNMKFKKSDKNSKVSTPKNTALTMEQTTETPASSEKKNAFKFMMDSRHRTIGSNSPGRERDSNEEINSPSRDKLHERKRTLNEWAERKGGAKRKLDERAKDKYIERTLHKRAKRMINLLSGGQSVSEEEEIVKVSVKKPRVLSDSEESNDTNTNMPNMSETEVDLQEDVNTCAPKSTVSSHSENGNESIGILTENYNESKTSAFQVSLLEKKEEEDEIFSPQKLSSKEKHEDDIILSPSLKKTSLLHYFDIKTSKNTSPMIEKKIEFKKNSLEAQEEQRSLIKIKLNFTPKKTKHEKNNDDSISLSNKSKKIKKKHRRSLSLRKSQDNVLADLKPEEIEIASCVKNTLCEKENFEKSEIVNKSTSTDNSKKVTLSLKKPKRIKHSEKSSQDNKFDVEEQECQHTPKKWKMKLRLMDTDETQQQELKYEPNENSNDVASVNDNNDKALLSDEDIEEVQSDDEIFPAKSAKSEQPFVKNELVKSKKIAPLFLMSRKADVLAANEAKRRFLHSGVPLGLKNGTGRSSPLPVTREPVLFPVISHVQQSDDSELWKLPVVSFSVQNVPVFSPKSNLGLLKIGSVTSCSVIPPNLPSAIECIPPGILPNLKYLVQQLKQQLPNYPVYKVFKSLRNKCGIRYNKPIPIQDDANEPILKSSKKKKRGRPKKKKEEIIDVIILDDSFVTDTLVDMSIWTEKYKPQCASDVLGNINVVRELETWLQSWAIRRIEKKQKQRRDSTSSDDFCMTDSDTQDSCSSMLENTLILTGPHGAGKTCAVYAICHQLNINVIEINASSRRLGKKLLADLQEATKSHRVKSKNGKLPFVTKDCVTESSNNGRMTLLLVEDADIVFDDQDEGFISALNTLIVSSKRPIVVTTSNPNCTHLQKLISQHRVLEFRYISERQIIPWLELLCLCEGLHVDREQLLRLLRWTNADLRQTLLHLQFWVLSGGDKVNFTKNLHSLTENIKIPSEIATNCEDDSNLSWMCEEESQKCTENIKMHVSCVDSFIPYYEKGNCNSYIPFPIDLGNIWWNLPSLWNIKSFKREADDRLDNIKCLIGSKEENCDTQEYNNIENEKEEKKAKSCDLHAISEILDCLAFADVTYTQLGLDVDNEPCGSHNFYTSHGMSINETFHEHSDFEREQLELAHFLVENSMQLNQANNTQVDVGLPTECDRQDRKKRITCLKRFSDIASINSQTDRRALNCDYASALRDMCRSEKLRGTDTGKRNNRFYHYLRALATPLTDVDTNVACTAFNLTSF